MFKTLIYPLPQIEVMALEAVEEAKLNSKHLFQEISLPKQESILDTPHREIAYCSNKTWS